MPMATFYSDDATIKITLGATAAKGDVLVVNNRVGVLEEGGVSGDVRALSLRGVFWIAKATGGAINDGVTLYWDNTNKVATTTSSGNQVLGKAAAAALSADTVVLVRLFQ